MIGNYAGEVAARLDRLPYTATLKRFVLLISLGGIFELYDLFLNAYIAPGLVRSGLFTTSPAGFFDPHGVGFFVFSTFAGMWVGCVCFGFIADRFGRRSIFTFALVWYSLATAVMAFQSTAEGIVLWRFIAAVGVGLEQITIDTFLPELVPPKNRGAAFARYQFIEFLIVPVVALLGWLWIPHRFMEMDGWRWVVLLGSVGALSAWWLRRALPESPRWLALHGHDAKAEVVLAKIEAGAAKDVGLDSLPPPPPHHEPVIAKSSIMELFKPPYAKRTLVLSIFNLMQTIGFYGFGSWVPTLLIAKGITVTTSLQYAFIIALANPVGPLLGLLFADKMERRYQIACAGVLVGIFIYLFAIQTNPALIIVLGVLVTLSNNWISFVFHGYQAEQYPTRIRARAVGFVYSWSRVSAAFAGLFGEKTLSRRLEEISQ